MTQKSGLIFDIQRFSIYDGPGIRTNVFFKGCNLRCVWCHNPESQKRPPELMFRSDKCVGCGACLAVCDRLSAIAAGEKPATDCSACGKCAAVCRHGAREISGRTATVDEVVRTVLRDRAFYKTSGGGVTLSGGEALLQIDFAAAILHECHEKGIHTAIETAGNLPWEYFERILPDLDLVLFDLKCMDEEKHVALIGADNKRILANAQKLKDLYVAGAVDLLFRTPVVPGLNEDEVEKIAAFAGNVPYELLAYHTTGSGKYAALGREYGISEIVPPTAEHMEELAARVGARYSKTGI